MDQGKKFEIIYPKNQIRKEVKKMTDQNNDEKRFTEEEKKVEEYILKHPEVSYREACLAVLDRSEPETKVEFTEEEKQYIEKQKEDEKKVEEYIESHPKIEYREAAKIVLNRGELTSQEKIVEQYIEKRKSQGIEVTYREACLATLSESEGSVEDQEIINMHVTINDLIYSLSRAEKSSVFKTEDKIKINQASDLIAEVKESLQKIIDKKGKPEEE